ncbi:MAG: 16S rRNA (adenine(1518)-N(6)/adenine(1519)-N(6))-dimethyltransferase RsmA [Xanthomonadales bacterium]|nr:16S rRNA (adenine(1518)-N(6)/adenine(1519)-N(6))-dimethyltransferase RsmA [Xanthomonadales bacterium]
MLHALQPLSPDPPLSLERHRHKKQLGQHFLHDTTVIDRIILALQPQPEDRLVEIGPGGGALTFPLLRQMGRLQVIEFDRDLIEPLRQRAASIGALEVVHADVLDVDLCALSAGAPLRLVGNLPYNISTPILFHVLDHARCIRDMVFMLQKEVVDRMAAAPGGKDYGRLTVMLQAVADVQPLFVVPPEAFDPPPKVDSAIVRVVPRADLAARIGSDSRFDEVVRHAFAQRRKTLRNALSKLATAAQIEASGIDPSLRAEAVAVERFIDLGNALARDSHA